MARTWFYLAILVVSAQCVGLAQSVPTPKQVNLPATIGNSNLQTTDDWNRRIQELVEAAVPNTQNKPSPADYRIGSDDELAINVLEAPDLSSAYRVSADGNISMPLLGTIKVAGLTPHETELVLEALLRRTYMKDPQVTVTVVEMQSHTVSVLGAVQKPGVFQIRGTKTLLEMLSMAGGLASDAGDAVLVMRGADADFAAGNARQIQTVKGMMGSAPGEGNDGSSSVVTKNENTVEVSLKQLLQTGDPRYNVPVYPGDIVKVKPAAIVYVVGEVNRPGGFLVKDNEHITVLQAVAMGEGFAQDAEKSQAKIIRVAQDGQQIELPVNLAKVLHGKSPDLPLRPRDILFVPRNGARTAARAALRTLSQVAIWRSIP
jgi:polysaccharide export outer membrane protein